MLIVVPLEPLKNQLKHVVRQIAWYLIFMSHALAGYCRFKWQFIILCQEKGCDILIIINFAFRIGNHYVGCVCQ